MQEGVFDYCLGVQLGVDVSKGCVEHREDGVMGQWNAIGVEFDDYGGGGAGVVIGGWGKIAGGVSMRLAIRP